ncbi:unnamed protein product, partial [Rotaria magnacalcarata]
MTLDVDQGASISEIKRAYRELSKKHHPDRGGDPEKFASFKLKTNSFN